MGKSDYYDRTNAVTGAPVFANAEDTRNEEEVAGLFAAMWGCEVHRFGPFDPIDFYVMRKGHLVGLLECKSRTHTIDEWPTVFLNLRKWMALTMGSCGFGVSAIYVARFKGGDIRWINVSHINAHHSKVKMGGCSRVVKSHTDVEPVILVPIKSMHELRTSEEEIADEGREIEFPGPDAP